MNKIIEISIKIIKTVWLFIFLVWNFMVISAANLGLYTILTSLNVTENTKNIGGYMVYLMPIYAMLLLTAVLYYTIKIWGIDRIVLNKWRIITNGRN